MQARESAERGLEFDRKYQEVMEAWERFSTSSVLFSFRVVRDRVTAHTELQFNGAEYRPVDISSPGIKWGHLRRAIDDMQVLVELLNNLIRDAGFAWQAFDRMVEEAGTNFWPDRDLPMVSRSEIG